MKPLLLAITFLLVGLTSNAQTLKGKVGKYPVEMEIQSVDWVTGKIEGKYKYSRKDAYIELKGEVLQGIIYLEEFFKGKSTGNFYLEGIDDRLEGKWIGGTSWYDVVLYPDDKAWEMLNSKSLEDYSKEVSPRINGGYADENYFINDMWFQEDNPQLEIGLNGGALVLEEVHTDSLRFYVNAVCGPTYHIAYATGVAHKVSPAKYECLIEAYENDTCLIYLELKEKEVHVWAKGNFLCGFGARAYLDHTFTKITDRYVYPDDEIFIGDLKEVLVE